MGQVSKTLRKSNRGYTHYCPGCKTAHHIPTPRWKFNENVECPTFSPSIRIFLPADEEEGVPEETLCHYFITDGQLQFCGDCPHELKGQTVPLPELPNYMQNDNWNDG